ncbi:glycosyltransferase [Fodinicurvata fenggangensis]|uniref:glycosyltransferase n=1 Tax=Fodinicurvata fenggangensis TaxID=1121830 RepID=UPI0012DF0FB0|nr:glycosyltransferase [Fodinicurvata fenggangensis]
MYNTQNNTITFHCGKGELFELSLFITQHNVKYPNIQKAPLRIKFYDNEGNKIPNSAHVVGKDYYKKIGAVLLPEDILEHCPYEIISSLFIISPPPYANMAVIHFDNSVFLKRYSLEEINLNIFNNTAYIKKKYNRIIDLQYNLVRKLIKLHYKKEYYKKQKSNMKYIYNDIKSNTNKLLQNFYLKKRNINTTYYRVLDFNYSMIEENIDALFLGSDRLYYHLKDSIRVKPISKIDIEYLKFCSIKNIIIELNYINHAGRNLFVEDYIDNTENVYYEEIINILKEHGVNTILIKSINGNDNNTKYFDFNYKSLDYICNYKKITPVRESDYEEVFLYPNASDLFEFNENIELLDCIPKDNLIITDNKYRFSESAFHKYISSNQIIVDCDGYEHYKTLLKKAQFVIITEYTLKSKGSIIEIVIDSIAAGSLPIYIGNEEYIREFSQLVFCIPEFSHLPGYILQFRNNWFVEKEWLKRYRIFFNNNKFDNLIEKLGGKTNKNSPLVSMIAVTKRPKNINYIINNYRKQLYLNKELIIINNTNTYIDNTFYDESIIIYNIQKEFNIGYCLNYAIRKSKGEYWFKVDDDDYYGKYYISDMVMAYIYSGADAIGKPQYLTYLEDTDIIIGRNAGQKYRKFLNEGEYLCGATLSGRKQSNLPEFSHRTRNGNDSEWVRNLYNLGYNIYFSDFLNFVVHRAKNKSGHTWKESDQSIIQKSNISFEDISINILE